MHNLNLNQVTGTYAFFSTEKPTWHKLGKIIAEYPTSAEAIEHAQLGFEVVKCPLKTEVEGMQVRLNGVVWGTIDLSVPTHYATVRTDTNQVLGVVGKDYAVVQNRDAFSFFDSIVGGGDGILYETAGALGNGERIFITAKLPGYIRVGDDDITEKYLFLTTSHDGTGSITGGFTPTRIVCNNTLNAALKNMTNSIKIRHTQGAKARLEQAHKLMGMCNTLADSMQELFNAWSKYRITDRQTEKLIERAMAPKDALQLIKDGKRSELSTAFKNVCTDVNRFARVHPSQTMVTTEGTLFGLYNAVTGYYQNVKKYKDDEAKMKSIFYEGTAQTRAQSAFDICSAVFKSGVDAVLS